MRRTLGIVILLWLCTLGPVQAQLAVVDAPNLTRNTVTAIQSTITAIEAVIQSAYMLLELTPLDDIAIAADFAETMGLLQELAGEGAALMGDASQAQAQIGGLFGLEAAPRNLQALNERMGEIKEVLFESRRYAIRVQTLISTINSAVGHIIRIVEIISVLSGNMSANQAQIQLLAVANQTLATQQAQQAAHQRAEVLDKLARAFVVESYRIIEAERWNGWPSF